MLNSKGFSAIRIWKMFMLTMTATGMIVGDDWDREGIMILVIVR